MMKKLYSIIAAMLITASVLAQAPEKMSYQAVVRNASDALLSSTPIGMQISILQGSAIGTAVYVETQTPTTNINGLLSLEIGTGTLVSGDFTTIDWTSDIYFIKTEIDPTGNATYTITGTSQLMSVPYALYAKTSGSSLPGPAGPTGSDGIDGATGPMGSQGPMGLNGIDGIDGLDGATGPQGPMGLNGASGIDGIDGIDGATGPQGPMGLTGASGIDGIDGIDGATGPQGPMGLTGDSGIDGIDGIDGATGPQGPMGLTGASGIDGIDGIDGLDGATGPMGPQGPMGLNGIDGIDGLDGATGPQGPQGSQGFAGIDGVDGLDGATGPMGPQGPAGLNGADGIDGAVGANGIDGVDGIDGATGPAGTYTAGTGIDISAGVISATSTTGPDYLMLMPDAISSGYVGFGSALTVKGIGYNSVTDEFTLKAGKTYMLDGAVYMHTTTSAVTYSFVFYDKTNGVSIGTEAYQRTADYSGAVINQPTMAAIITPVTDIQVGIKDIYGATGGFISSRGFFRIIELK